MKEFGGLTREEWEGLCDGCGLCCQLDSTGFACPQFNCETRLCRDYSNRESREMCVQLTVDNVPSMHAKGILPDTCGYVRHMKGESPLDDPPKAELKEFAVAPPILQHLYIKQRKEWLEDRGFTT